MSNDNNETCSKCDFGDEVFENGLCADCYWEEVDDDYEQNQDSYYED